MTSFVYSNVSKNYHKSKSTKELSHPSSKATASFFHSTMMSLFFYVPSLLSILLGTSVCLPLILWHYSHLNMPQTFNMQNALDELLPDDLRQFLWDVWEKVWPRAVSSSTTVAYWLSSAIEQLTSSSSSSSSSLQSFSASSIFDDLIVRIKPFLDATLLRFTIDMGQYNIDTNDNSYEYYKTLNTIVVLLTAWFYYRSIRTVISIVSFVFRQILWIFSMIRCAYVNVMWIIGFVANGFRSTDVPTDMEFTSTSDTAKESPVRSQTLQQLSQQQQWTTAPNHPFLPHNHSIRQAPYHGMHSASQFQHHQQPQRPPLWIPPPSNPIPSYPYYPPNVQAAGSTTTVQSAFAKFQPAPPSVQQEPNQNDSEDDDDDNNNSNDDDWNEDDCLKAMGVHKTAPNPPPSSEAKPLHQSAASNASSRSDSSIRSGSTSSRSHSSMSSRSQNSSSTVNSRKRNRTDDENEDDEDAMDIALETAPSVDDSNPSTAPKSSKKQKLAIARANAKKWANATFQ